jgi:hypothetical protein
MRSISFTITIALLAGFYFAVKDYPTPEKAEPFHAEILRQVDTLPDNLGEWRTTERPEPPAAARQLLRPNALLTRRLEKMDTNLDARLIIVQTKDSRDMGGHYPPECYPNSGWQETKPWPAAATMRIGSIDVPYQVYTFKQSTFRGDKAIKIYCFFAIPGSGFKTDIKDVRRAAEDYRVRPFGCAQIQVLMDAGMPEDISNRIFVELVSPLEPLLKDLSSDPLAVVQRVESQPIVPATTEQKATP